LSSSTVVTQPCWRPIRYGCAAPSQSCPIGARCRNHHTRNRTPMNPGRWLGRCVSIGAACGVFSNHDAAALGPGRRPIVAPKGGWLGPRHCGVLEALVRRRVRSSPSGAAPFVSASARVRLHSSTLVHARLPVAVAVEKSDSCDRTGRFGSPLANSFAS